MLGCKDRRQPELFVAGSLKDLLPGDHVLVRVDKVLDLDWLTGEVADLYSPDRGRPGIAPEVAVRLMLAGLLLGIVHDRRLLREAQVNLAIRWFIGYGLHEALPDHSSLTRIRQRWGAERFRHIFTRSVRACVAAGIATGEIVHIDSSLVRADVSWDAIARRHVAAMESANGDEGPPDGQDGGPKPPMGKKPALSVCTTDPDATLTTTRRLERSKPAYKHHTAVDRAGGVVLDVVVTTGAVHDTQTVTAQLEAIGAATGRAIAVATMDAGYAITRVFAELEGRGIEAVIPAKAERSPKKGVIPVRRFKLDARNGVVRCPAGKLLRPHGQPDSDGFQHYRARVPDCRPCRLRALPTAGHVLQWPDAAAGDPAAQGSSRPAAGTAQGRALGRARTRALSQPPHPGRGLPRRGQDLAWTGPGRPARPRQHADPSLSRRRRHQPQAAGHHSASDDAWPAAHAKGRSPFLECWSPVPKPCHLN